MSNDRKKLTKTRSISVELDELYECEVIGLTHDGAGVGQVDGYTLFIRDALPGDLVIVRVVHLRKNYGFAEIHKLLKYSSDRMEPPCKVFAECGGCQLQHLNYEAQLRWKTQLVVDNLQRIGKLEQLQTCAFTVKSAIGMESPWRYRNKVQVPVAVDTQSGNIVTGFYAGGTHRIVDADECLIQHDWSDRVVAYIKSLAESFGISVYDEITHTGCLRQIMVRVGQKSKEMMVVFVTNGPDLKHKKLLVEHIRTKFPQVVSILQNVNSARTNVILGDKNILLWGKQTITDYIGDVQFAISAKSFYQVNPEQTVVLYEKVLEYAALNGTETVIDAYCGIGTISLFLARRARHVYGVEIVEQAITDAWRNAELNGIQNATFVVGAAEQVLPQWREQGVVADVIVVDPPRKGCDVQLLHTLILMEPQRIVYVSCNPATLARDVKLLVEGGYEVIAVQPVDMFPHTTHIEAVCLLERP